MFSMVIIGVIYFLMVLSCYGLIDYYWYYWVFTDKNSLFNSDSFLKSWYKNNNITKANYYDYNNNRLDNIRLDNNYNNDYRFIIMFALVWPITMVLLHDSCVWDTMGLKYGRKSYHD